MEWVDFRIQSVGTKYMKFDISPVTCLYLLCFPLPQQYSYWCWPIYPQGRSKPTVISRPFALQRCVRMYIYILCISVFQWNVIDSVKTYRSQPYSVMCSQTQEACFDRMLVMRRHIHLQLSKSLLSQHRLVGCTLSNL